MSYLVDSTDDKFAKEVADIITGDLATRFPDGVPEDLMVKMFESCLNAFYNGARWAEEAMREENEAFKRDCEKVLHPRVIT